MLNTKNRSQRRITTAILLVTLLGAATVANAETAEAKIARAITAAPSDITNEATIMDVNGTVLRGGTNGWVCLPGVGLIPGDQHPQVPWGAALVRLRE